ncbi:MAG: SRPBCC family protein [Vulcanimicrobiaceae bacterium]
MTTPESQEPRIREQPRWIVGSIDVDASAEEAFASLRTVERWPAWLTFLHSARLGEPRAPLQIGSDVILRSVIPGEPEELYEVDAYIENFHLSLVGAYSTRRRLDFRLERRTSRCRVHVRIAYPAYYGRLGAIIDGITVRRRLNAELARSLLQFKGLVELAVIDQDC